MREVSESLVGVKNNDVCEVGLSPHGVTKVASSVAIITMAFNDVAAHQRGCSVKAAVQLAECRQAVMGTRTRYMPHPAVTTRHD